MLTELSLTNFKAWKRIEKMRLSPITGLFGTNSSGKSSILQFLLMLKQTAESADKQQVLYFGEEKSEKSFVVLGAFECPKGKRPCPSPPDTNSLRVDGTLEP